MAVIGFAGLTMEGNGIRLDPRLPKGWHNLTFPVQWRGRHLSIRINNIGAKIEVVLDVGDVMNVTVGTSVHRLSRAARVITNFDMVYVPLQETAGLAPAA